MNVSKREEELAKELYEMDMSIEAGQFTPWESQIHYVHTHYRRLAMRVVNSRWFAKQMTHSDAARDRLES